ncbi:hypothetical protein [Pusillimonas sp. ANT_WB101]|uniref:hypothetical protein n=1 Tax=Pusillimonas sp. ANT_WB101 TaxID=2597356 RepID=UPI00165E548A|nr:hypothetical protein [Pusillimonas sp. ANT_WB101]
MGLLVSRNAAKRDRYPEYLLTEHFRPDLSIGLFYGADNQRGSQATLGTVLRSIRKRSKLYAQPYDYL